MKACVFTDTGFFSLMSLRTIDSFFL